MKNSLDIAVQKATELRRALQAAYRVTDPMAELIVAELIVMPILEESAQIEQKLKRLQTAAKER